MAKQAVYQVRMDEEIKEQVESLYRSMGTSFAEAVRIFAVQSIREQGMPFTPSEAKGKAFGALSGYAKPTLLTEEETAEQAELRREYLAEFRENMKAMLDSTIIQEPDGTRHALKQKDNPPAQ